MGWISSITKAFSGAAKTVEKGVTGAFKWTDGAIRTLENGISDAIVGTVKFLKVVGNDVVQLGDTGVNAVYRGGKWYYENGPGAGQEITGALANKLNEMKK